MLENPGRLIWIRDGAYEEHMIYNRANGSHCEDELPYFLQRTSFSSDGLATGKKEHPEQDETHNIGCNCLHSDIYRLSWPDESAISWYEHDPMISNP